MFSPRRQKQTSIDRSPAIRAGCALLLAVTLITGCSKQPPASSEDDWSLDPANTLRAAIKAGGIDTTYTAQFDGTQIKRIDEVRRLDADRAAKGSYEFNGARLIRYRGDALRDAADIELQFDMHGVLLESKGASDEEVAAIRDRASLLRSLALTRRTTQSHGG
ncbi:MAG TPA: hypothetical protein PKE27_09815 [Povalibacter sp.]|uniref:hypothetical protein n=1 Tax=Povalibacter sp. TaxID=1962978 RepID=UPI002B769D7A|nr:hypothetical protein [Povalibacter sp.]HMN44859.1 hypothetical protein [Povalibacter sp.]